MIAFIDGLLKNHRLTSMAGAAFFAAWIGQRFYFSYRPSLLWWLITFQFILFVAAYLTRLPPKERARGVMETVFPFVCAFMPFALDEYPFKPKGAGLAEPEVYLAFMLIGTLIIIAGIFNLRRSFSIMAEVRKPIYIGVYRITRHPMYLGSMVSSLGLILYNFSILNALIFVLFCVMQVYRAGLEETKIAGVYPEYLEYAGRVGWLWKIGRK